MVKDLMDSNKAWDLKKLREIFSDPRDVKDISQLFKPQSPADDRRIWPTTKNGVLTTNQLTNASLKRN